VDGELVWEDRSTNLCRMPNPDYKDDAADRAEGLAVGRRPLNNNAERWRLGADLGRRYARVSGDRNPIHLWKLSAKMLGFKRQIVHGMWSKARVCAAIEPALADAPVCVRCEFKQPIFLPGKVHFYRASEKSSELAEIWDTQGTRPHMVARFDPV
jgi:acyl dehydratase